MKQSQAKASIQMKHNNKNQCNKTPKMMHGVFKSPNCIANICKICAPMRLIERPMMFLPAVVLYFLKMAYVNNNADKQTALNTFPVKLTIGKMLSDVSAGALLVKFANADLLLEFMICCLALI